MILPLLVDKLYRMQLYNFPEAGCCRTDTIP
jgi:hypothetical protein